MQIVCHYTVVLVAGLACGGLHGGEPGRWKPIVVPFVQPGWVAPVSQADGQFLDQAHEVWVEAPGGKLRAFSCTQTVPFTDEDGHTRPKVLSALVVLTNHLVWIGPPTTNLVVLSDRIVAFNVVGGEFLHVGIADDVLTNTQVIIRPSDLTPFLKANAGLSLKSWKAGTEMNLASLVGEENLGDMRLAIIPEPAIKAVFVQGQEIVVTLKSANDKVIVLILNEGLQPVRASVDGKVVWEKRGSPTKP